MIGGWFELWSSGTENQVANEGQHQEQYSDKNAKQDSGDENTSETDKELGHQLVVQDKIGQEHP